VAGYAGTGRSGGRSLVLRGASWNNDNQNNLLSSYRNNNTPDNRNNNNGFRCVLVGGGGSPARRFASIEANDWRDAWRTVGLTRRGQEAA
jgi:hypothetical protein